MNKAMFSDAKVGDRVWSVVDGWGEVIINNEDSTRPLRVEFKKRKDYFYLDGKKYEKDLTPTLFWDEVKIVPPERPHVCKFEADPQFLKCSCGRIKTTPLKPLNPERPKEKCEACELIEDCERNCFGRGTRVYIFLLNQHHTCEKETTNG